MAVSHRAPKSPSTKPIGTSSRGVSTIKTSPMSLATLAYHAAQQTPAFNSLGGASVHSKSTTASAKSSATRRRLAFSKNLTADKKLYIPRADTWSHGDVTVQSVQTGNPLFVVNHYSTLEATRDCTWQGGGITEAIVSEVDPSTKKVGKILALVRNEGIKYIIYTYFRAYEGQPVSFVDGTEFYQGNMFRHGEIANSKKRCAFSLACTLADHGLDFVRPVLEVATAGGRHRNREWALDMRDCKTKERQMWRQVDVDAVTIRAGLNLVVATCLVYAAESVMNA